MWSITTVGVEGIGGQMERLRGQRCRWMKGAASLHIAHAVELQRVGGLVENAALGHEPLRGQTIGRRLDREPAVDRPRNGDHEDAEHPCPKILSCDEVPFPEGFFSHGRDRMGRARERKAEGAWGWGRGDKESGSVGVRERGRGWHPSPPALSPLSPPLVAFIFSAPSMEFNTDPIPTAVRWSWLGCAMVVVVLGAPMLLVLGPAPRQPFDEKLLRLVKKEQPRCVLMGDSMLETRIDQKVLNRVSGQSCLVLSHSGSSSATWFLMLKNLVAVQATPPRSVIILFRNRQLTLPAHRTQGEYRRSMEPFMRDVEPVLE